MPDATTAALPALEERGTDWLLIAGVAAVAASMIRAAFFTPADASQGDAQRIFYVHAPSAFVGLYFSCGLVFLSSAGWLWLKDERLDRVADASAEVGLAFLTIVLVTGPIWGKPIWGTWWTWDARLTLTLFLWFVLLGYQILRGAVEDERARARFAAVLGVLGGLLVPFIHLSVYFFRTLHPMPILLKPGSPSLSNEMLVTFAASMASFVLLFAALLRARYRLAVDRDTVAALEAQG